MEEKEEEAEQSTEEPKPEYSEDGLSPVKDFNERGDVLGLLRDSGWREDCKRGNRIYFTRPGKKDGVSASWNTEKRIFWVFTSSTNEFAENKGYNATSVFIRLCCGGDLSLIHISEPTRPY